MARRRKPESITEMLERWLDWGGRVRPAAAVAFCALAGIVMGMPTLLGGFLSGDDFKFAVNYRYLDELSFANAWRLLTMIHIDLYQPLPMLSFQLNHAMAAATPDGPAAISPLVFHITNMLLHGLNAVLVFAFVSRLARDRRIGMLTAFMFAMHPLAVEPVAWISGRMILLGTTFSLATLCFCVYRRTNGRGLWPLWAGLSWLCALASKVMPTVPIAAAICDWYLRRRVNRRTTAVFGTLLLMAIVTSGFAYWTTSRMGAFAASNTETSTSAVVKLLLAARAYLENYVMPLRLAGWTPPPEDVPFLSIPVGVALLELAAFGLLTWWAWKKNRLAFVGIVLFVVLLAPFFAATLGRRLLVADRYMYLPIVGLHLAVTSAVFHMVAVMGEDKRIATAISPLVFCGTILFWWAYVSVDQAAYWRNSVARAERVRVVYSSYSSAWANSGAAYLFQGRPDEALRTLEAAREKWPENGRLASAEGQALLEIGRDDEAIQSLRLAVERLPRHPRTLLNLGLALDRSGQREEAETVFRRLLEVAPGYTPAVIALARNLVERSRSEDAIALLRKRVSAQPEDRDARHELATLLLTQRDWRGARDEFARLVADDPQDQRSMLHLAVTQSMLGQDDEALATYDRLLAADSRVQISRINRAGLLVKMGRFDAAEADYREVLAQTSDNIEARIGLHHLLQRMGRFTELPPLWKGRRSPQFSEAENDAWLAWSYALAGDEEALADTVVHQEYGLPNVPANVLMRWAPAWPAIVNSDAEACLKIFGPFDANVQAMVSQSEFARTVLTALTTLPEATRQSDLGYYVLARALWLEGNGDAAILAATQLHEQTQDAAWQRRADELVLGIEAATRLDAVDSKAARN